MDTLLHIHRQEVVCMGVCLPNVVSVEGSWFGLLFICGSVLLSVRCLHGCMYCQCVCLSVCVLVCFHGCKSICLFIFYLFLLVSVWLIFHWTKLHLRLPEERCVKSYRKSCKATFFTPAHKFPTSINIRLFHSCLPVFNADLPCHAQLVSGNLTELFVEGRATQTAGMRPQGVSWVLVARQTEMHSMYVLELCCCLGHDTLLTYMKQKKHFCSILYQNISCFW